MRLGIKYPSTPYWPWSPTIGRGDAFVTLGHQKLDAGNTLLPSAGQHKVPLV